MTKTIHVIVSGKVQGVFFRANTKQEAIKRSVTGWVRNTSDGKVEAVFQGKAAAVDDLVNWCYQGSPASRVENVSIEPVDDGPYDKFSIRY